MDHAIIPDPLKAQIAGFSGPTELRDQSGCVLGVFTPAVGPVSVEPELSLEKLRAIVAEPGGYTLEEIWRELGANELHSRLEDACQEEARGNLASRR